MQRRPAPDLSFELKHREDGRACVGVDEVGRGCLAGPVVTAAVVLPDFIFDSELEALPQKRRLEDLSEQGQWWGWINDSKLLAPVLREKLAALIWRHAHVQVAWCTVEEVDQWNILHAAMVAMRRALFPFAGLAQAVLVDGNLSPFDRRFRCPAGESERLRFSHVETLVKGDQRSLSIGAASIVAKVYRDQWMGELDVVYPGYAFADHKGYSTPAHYEALEKLGPCSLHRMSFAPLKAGLKALGRTGSTICTERLYDEGADQQSELAFD